jgi:phage protein D
MATLIQPKIILNWAGQNISEDLAPFVKSITYTDSLNTDDDSKPDSLSLTLNNKDMRFLNEWYPNKGDTLKAGLSYGDNQWMWGEFVIDDFNFRFSPDELVVGASAVNKKRAALDKKQSRAFDNVQLSTLLNIIASEANMTSLLTGSDTQITRVEQQSESSMSMLNRLGQQYGLAVNIKSNCIYMGIPNELPALTLSIAKRSNIQKLDLPDEVRNKVSAVLVEYYNQEQKKVLSYTAGNSTAEEAQILRLYDAPVSSHDEAKVYAESKLTEQSSKGKSTGSITLVGTPITSGQKITFTDIGKLHNTWQILSQTTTVTKTGWNASARIGKA